jgi:hypothetical protein
LLRDFYFLGTRQRPSIFALNLENVSLISAGEASHHGLLNDKLVEYAAKGGAVIFDCQCGSHVTGDDLNGYFLDIWNRSGKMDDYARSSFQTNENPFPSISGVTPTGERNVKAVQLKNIDPADVAYGIAKDGEIKQGPVIWSQHGHGRLASLGNVDFEERTIDIMMKMCGL